MSFYLTEVHTQDALDHKQSLYIYTKNLIRTKDRVGHLSIYKIFVATQLKEARLMTGHRLKRS